MPTDDGYAGSELKGSKAKKKAGLMGPVTIEPPQMPDWSAAFGSPASQPAAIQRGPYQENSAPAQVSASPYVANNEPANVQKLSSSQDPATAMRIRRQQMGAQDAGDLYDMQRINQMGPNVLAQYGGEAGARQELARLAAIRAARTKEGLAISAAQAPVNPVQTPTQYRDARTDINAQLGRTLLQQRIADAKAKGIEYNPDELAATAADDANAALPQYSGGTGAARGLEDPRVIAGIAAQRQLADRQTAQREVQAGVANDLTSKNLASEQDYTQTQDAARQIRKAAMQRAIAEQQGGAEMAGLEPKLAATEMRVKQAQLDKQLGRITGGGATLDDAQQAMDQRRAAYAVAGLDSPEAVQAFHTQATNEITKSDSQTFLARTLPKLQDIARNDPAEAARIARDWLVSLDQQEGGFLDAAGIANPGIAALRSSSKTARMVMRAKLKEIAGVQ